MRLLKRDVSAIQHVVAAPSFSVKVVGEVQVEVEVQVEEVLKCDM